MTNQILIVCNFSTEYFTLKELNYSFKTFVLKLINTV